MVVTSEALVVAGSNFAWGYFTSWVFSAFHPFGVGKWVPAIPGKAKAGMADSDCASAVVIHYEGALYQVYGPLPFYLSAAWKCKT